MRPKLRPAAAITGFKGLPSQLHTVLLMELRRVIGELPIRALLKALDLDAALKAEVAEAAMGLSAGVAAPSPACG